MRQALFVFVVGVFLAGCAGTVYSIKPIVNEGAKTLDIKLSDKKTIHLKNAKMEKSGNTIADEYTLKSVRRSKFRIATENSICNQMYLYISDTSSAGTTYIQTPLYERLDGEKGLICQKEDINNVQFIRCEKDYKSYYYVATLSGIKHGGYEKEEWFYMNQDDKCFNAFKDFAHDNRTYMEIGENFVDTSKSSFFSQNATTKHKPKLEKKKSEALNIYKGTFVSTKPSKCATIGKINIYINKDTIGGNISYKLKGEDFLSTLEGKIIDNNFAGQVEDIQFIGKLANEEIKGTYYSDKCEGKFSAELEK